MATLNFSYSTGNVTLTRINDALGETFGYEERIDGETNPETKAQFNRRKVGEWIMARVKEGEVRAARRTAEDGVTPVVLT